MIRDLRPVAVMGLSSPGYQTDKIPVAPPIHFRIRSLRNYYVIIKGFG